MNVNETLQILQALQACGATHFKSQDFEISISSKTGASVEQIVSPSLPPVQAQVPAVPQENKEATEKLKALINTMSLSPEQLADQIFPNGAV